MTTETCRKGRYRVIPFDCKLSRGHGGGCAPYTLRPLSRDERASLDPACRWRYRIDRADGAAPVLGTWRVTREEAETDLAGILPALTEMRDRYPYLPELTGTAIEDRGPANPAVTVYAAPGAVDRSGRVLEILKLGSVTRQEMP